LMRSRSVVPPMPSDVNSARQTPVRSSTANSGNAATILGSSIRMGNGRVGIGMFGPEQDHQFVAGAAHVPRSDGENGVAWARFAEQIFNAFLHGPRVNRVFVAGFQNRAGQGLTGHAGNGWLARGVNIRKD